MSVELLFQALIKNDVASQLEADAYFSALTTIDQPTADLVDQLLQPRANNLCIFQAALLAGKSDIYRYVVRHLNYPQQQTFLSAIDALIQLPIDKINHNQLRDLINECHISDARYYFQNKLLGKKILHAITSTNRVELLQYILDLSIPGMEYEFKKMLDNALDMAATHHRYDMVRYLLEKGANGTSTTLSNVVLTNNSLILRQLLAYPKPYTNMSYASAAETAIAHHYNDCLNKILDVCRLNSIIILRNLLNVAIQYRNKEAYSLLWQHGIITLHEVSSCKDMDVLNTLIESGAINKSHILGIIFHCKSNDTLLICLKHINKWGVMAKVFLENVFEAAIVTNMDLKPIIESIDPEQYNYLEFISPSHWAKLIIHFQNGTSHNLKTVLQPAVMTEKFLETMATVKIDSWRTPSWGTLVSPFEFIRSFSYLSKSKEMIELFFAAGVPVQRTDLQKYNGLTHPSVIDYLRRCDRWQNAITLFAKQKAEENPVVVEGIELKLMQSKS